MNWYIGWALILTGFAVGAVLGLFFHRDEFLGGYTAFPRRMLRLGHIALVALGMLNVLYAIAPCGNSLAGWLLMAGGVTMPAVCFLTALRRPCRHLFFVPVTCSVMAVVFILTGGAK